MCIQMVRLFEYTVICMQRQNGRIVLLLFDAVLSTAQIFMLRPGPNPTIRLRNSQWEPLHITRLSVRSPQSEFDTTYLALM